MATARGKLATVSDWTPQKLLEISWWQSHFRGWSFAHFVIDAAVSTGLTTLADGIWNLGLLRSIAIGLCIFVSGAGGVHIWLQEKEKRAGANLPDKRRRVNSAVDLLESMIASAPSEYDETRVAQWRYVCVNNLRETFQDNGVYWRFQEILDGDFAYPGARLASAKDWLKALKGRFTESDIRSFYG